MNGGDLIASVLEQHGVRFLFTLCGGHISPILVGCQQRGISVIDVRHEVSAVFAADAVARLSGTAGVAAVTAGPGVTNTITAVKNAELAQSPVVVLGGATATVLKGRGSLQDIDQLALVRPHVKWATSVGRVRDLVPALEKAMALARAGVPGPVFVECPVDLLYGEALVREWYAEAAGRKQPKSFRGRALQWYLRRRCERLFDGADSSQPSQPQPVPVVVPDQQAVRRAAARIAAAHRPLLVVGSQAMLEAAAVASLAEAVEGLGVPVYLTGMARGLLGREHPLLLRHKRRQALREADLVLLAGMPCDFRLDYGRQIRRDATLIAVNRSQQDLKKNRRPSLGLTADPGRFLRSLAAETQDSRRQEAAWLEALRQRDADRDAEIREQAQGATGLINPLRLCHEIDSALDDNSVLVVDGGDFVATASYIVRPRGPLSWLDPGVFGTLGVGGGFALGAKLCRPEAEVWLLYGDGSSAYSLAELDTMARHGLAVIAVVGNDAAWMQIARDQGRILGDDVGTTLRYSDYHLVAQGYGAKGLLLVEERDIADVLAEAKQTARNGQPVVINAKIGRTEFRKGSLSM